MTDRGLAMTDRGRYGGKESLGEVQDSFALYPYWDPDDPPIGNSTVRQNFRDFMSNLRRAQYFKGQRMCRILLSPLKDQGFISNMHGSIPSSYSYDNPPVYPCVDPCD